MLPANLLAWPSVIKQPVRKCLSVVLLLFNKAGGLLQAIAASPEGAVNGYAIGSYLYLGIMYAFPIGLGLGGLCLDLPVSIKTSGDHDFQVVVHSASWSAPVLPRPYQTGWARVHSQRQSSPPQSTAVVPCSCPGCAEVGTYILIPGSLSQMKHVCLLLY